MQHQLQRIQVRHVLQCRVYGVGAIVRPEVEGGNKRNVGACERSECRERGFRSYGTLEVQSNLFQLSLCYVREDSGRGAEALELGHWNPG